MTDQQSGKDAHAPGVAFFLPWLTLPRPTTIAGFRFTPVRVGDLAAIVGSGVADTLVNALRCYVDQSAKPIQSCTLVLRPRHAVPWNIPTRLWKAVTSATEILAIACLSEQRFFESHLSPHLNSTMFRVVGQPISAGSQHLALRYPRRGGALQVGGRKFSDTTFQQPAQIEGTSCSVVNIALAKALVRARRDRLLIWQNIESSLRLFLLAHSEAHDLTWET